MANVFLVEANSFSEAQVIKNLLVSQGLNPLFRDENIRTIAPHYEHLFGKIIIEIPDHEFIEASQMIERMIDENRSRSSTENLDNSSSSINYARKSLNMAVIGVFLLPMLGSFYSTILVFRAFKKSKFLNKQELLQTFAAMMINIFACCFWLIVIVRSKIF